MDEPTVEELQAFYGPVLAVTWEAEGCRLGVLVCPLCGSCLVVGAGGDRDPLALHYSWHRSMSPASVQPSTQTGESDG